MTSTPAAMRIGQFIESTDLRAGGTSIGFLNTIASLRTLPGVSVHAFSSPPPTDTDDPAMVDVLAHAGEWTLVKGTGRALGPGPLGRAVIDRIERGEIDVLHMHGLWLPDLVAAARACREHSVPYVWQPHGMLVRAAYAQKRWKKELFMAAGLRQALRDAAGLIFVTSEERDTSVLPVEIGAERRFVVPLPVSVPSQTITAEYRMKARERFGIPPDAPTVVFLGRLHPVKRLDMALRALREASRTLPRVRLLIVGGGEDALMRELERLAQELNVHKQVTFAGWVQGEDKWKALAAGDVLTLNSMHENFGFVAVEALCVGTRPVLTNNLALAGELAGAGLAESCEPSDAALAAAWNKALRALDAETLMRQGRAWVDEHLSFGAIGATLVDVYTQVRRKPGAGA